MSTSNRPEVGHVDVARAPLSGESGAPALGRFGRELAAIMDISRAVSTMLHLDELLPRIMERTTELMSAERSTFFIVDAARNELWSKVVQGDRPQEIRLRIGDGIAGWVAQSGRSLNLEDAYADPRFDRSWDDESGYSTRSLLCVPIFDKEGRTVAVIQCLNKRDRSFDAEDEQLLSCIGGQCAVAIENSFLYGSLLEKNRALAQTEAQLRRANAEIDILYDVERQIAAAADVDALIAGVLGRVQMRLGAATAALLLVEDTAARVVVKRGGHAEVHGREVDPEEAQGLLLRSRFPIVRRIDAAGGLADALCAGEPGAPLYETWSAPLTAGGSRIGILQIGNRASAEESAEEAEQVLRVLSLVSAQLARGIVARREREAGERAERLALLGHSLGALLHDMRTPLTAVGGYVELMTEESSADVRRDHAERVGRALGHMEAMTTEVLAFARGQREVLIAKVYLDRFVAEVREMLVPELQRFGTELVIDVRYEGVARFDENKCKRVILNLARNACQAMGHGGKFTWMIDRIGEHLVFECSDDGPGIPKEMEGRLFHSFATHGKADGTGLGLAMAKKIVDAHCGRIGVRSAPGQGATFRIEIPA